jgi:hypothetical protein
MSRKSADIVLGADGAKTKQGSNMSATESKKVAPKTVGEFLQERREEFVETFNRMSKQTVDLFEKTLGIYYATSVPDAQRRVHDIIESSLSALQVNVDSALKTNAKVIADWTELVNYFALAEK